MVAFGAQKTRTLTVHCLVQILVQRHNWTIYTRKWPSEAVTVNGDRYRDMFNEFLFTKILWGRYWQHLVSIGWRYMPHSRSYTRCFAPCFWISHYQPQRWCRLATFKLWFDNIGLLFVECRVIIVLRRQARDNIREAISEIQLHLIDNVL